MENKKIHIIFFGTPGFVVPVLKTLEKNFKVVCVVTAPDTIQGRKKLLTPSPIKQFVLDNLSSIPILTPQQFNNGAMQQLSELKPDLFIVAAYGKIIPQSILDLPKYGAINIHPSLLPKYRGPSPIQTALLNGDQTTGISIIKMDAKMDHGPIVAQWEVPISPQDTFATLYVSLFENAANRLPEIITDYLSKKITPTTQDETKATICKMITRESGYFDSSNPPSPEELDRMIRAYYPWPTAYTKLRIKNEELRIVKFLPSGKIQMEGGKAMTVKEFLNGYPELTQQLEKLLETQL